MNATLFARFSLLLALNASLYCGRGQAETLIDLNPDNGRSDVVTPHAFNWPINEGHEFVHVVDGVEVRIAANSADGKLRFGWWKAGYDSGAKLSSDGVTSEKPGESISLTLNGLAPGEHSLAIWLNTWSGAPTAGSMIAEVEQANQLGEANSVAVVTSHRVGSDDDAATAYVRFQVTENGIATIHLRPSNPAARIELNGFAWDIPNPVLQAIKHLPANDDEHVQPNPILRWERPKTEAALSSYLIYLGTNQINVLNATPDSPEYLGSTSATEMPTSATDPYTEYFWRIDTLFEDAAIARGQVRRFRIRQVAFPGAEGYGRFAMGGRGGRTIEVTNLNDSGPGSLRAAVEESGPRTVVFRVDGTIQLKSKLLIRHPYITIAGQTAPGDGICVRGYTFGCFGTHDVIMRYIRVRVGDESGETMDGTGFASSDHCILDHCSISWSIDEAVSSRSARNITLQRCIVAEALNIANHRKYEPGKGHSFAGSISGDIGSFHHNLLAHCAGRNWSLAGGLDNAGRVAGRLDIRNNVVFNWQHRTNDGGVKALNLVNNLYLPGPATRVFHLLKPDVGFPGDPQQYFVDGNAMEGHFGSQNNWQDAVVVAPESLKSIRLDEPFCESFVSTHASAELLENVLSDVGANHHGWDSADLRVLENVRKRSTTHQGSRSNLPGIIDSQTDVGGWPHLEPGQAPEDSDHDGLPDVWEVARGLDPAKQDQSTRLGPSNSTALEQYLNELAASN